MNKSKVKSCEFTYKTDTIKPSALNSFKFCYGFLIYLDEQKEKINK